MTSKETQRPIEMATGDWPAPLAHFVVDLLTGDDDPNLCLVRTMQGDSEVTVVATWSGDAVNGEVHITPLVMILDEDQKNMPLPLGEAPNGDIVFLTTSHDVKGGTKELRERSARPESDSDKLETLLNAVDQMNGIDIQGSDVQEDDQEIVEFANEYDPPLDYEQAARMIQDRKGS